MSKTKIVVFYQPHQNIRQHTKEIQEGYKTCFEGCDIVYWLPTFLSRENPNLKVMTPEELIKIATAGNNYNVVDSLISLENREEGSFDSNSNRVLDSNKSIKKPICFVAQKNLEEALENIKKHTIQKDLVIGMGAGNIDTLIRQAWAQIQEGDKTIFSKIKVQQSSL